VLNMNRWFRTAPPTVASSTHGNLTGLFVPMPSGVGYGRSGRRGTLVNLPPSLSLPTFRGGFHGHSTHFPLCGRD
jgi:hypothetical protein